MGPMTDNDFGANFNPLLADWGAIRGGAPDFTSVKVDAFKPAILAAIEENRTEIAAIVGDPAGPDFDNTLAALERCGETLRRVEAIYDVWTSAMNDKPMQAVEQEMAPVFAGFADEVVHNPALFARIESVFEAADDLDLTAEQRRLAVVTHRAFVRRGARLAKSDKAKLAAINQRLASLCTGFSQNVLADEEGQALMLEREADLAGLPVQLVGTAAAAARERGHPEGWLISNTRSSMEPFLTYSSRRDLREKGWRMWTSRGDGGEHDNGPIITEILGLRAEKAALLGFPTFVHWVCDDQMAKTPAAALDLLLQVWAPAKARAEEEAGELQAFAEADERGIVFQPWDWRYYAERARKAQFDIDENQLKAYLQLDSLREAMFWVAGRLFGLEFVEVSDLSVYEASVRTFEVRRGGQRVGLWYFDPFARPGKSSGAWMSEYRTQQRLAGSITPIVSNNANFIRGASGEPVLISWSDATTLFHEFGHGLHGLSSAVTYPSLAGTHVVRDFVELPSQLLERWLPTPQVLTQFCRHFRTGQPMPADLAEAIGRAHRFNKGFETVEYLASAILDLKVHLAGATPIDPREFEARALAELGMPSAIVMRHRMSHFGHIFAGESYAAGYYDYIWADVLTADVAEAFAEAPGGFYDGPTAARLESEIFSVGDTLEAGEAFRRFRGREPRIDALMRDRGFPVPEAA